MEGGAGLARGEPDHPLVGVARGEASYEPAHVRGLVAGALRRSGNPLDRLIRPGQSVFLKPNLIAHQRSGAPGEWVQIITHPTVIRAVLWEVAGRLDRGRVMIGDAPQTDSNFEAILDRLRLDVMIEELRERWPQIHVEVMDLRRECWVQEGDVTVRRIPLPGDPRGGTLVDLGRESEFADQRNNHQYYGADYDFADTRSHHSKGRHEYLLSRSVLDADVFINLPKLKTHKKAGVTLSLKNLVGINADKNYLPHYSLGSPSEHGDEFPHGGLKRRLESRGSRTFKRLITMSGGTAPWWGPLIRRLGVRTFGPTSKVVRSGNWWGNDTIWRMCLDLNRILLWYDGSGRRRSAPKACLTIVDGIVAGEGDGPVGADPCELGVVVAGVDPVAVDLTCVRLMGFDWRRIPILSNAVRTASLPISQVRETRVSVSSDVPSLNGDLEAIAPIRRTRPHFGWTGHIELAEDIARSG